MADYSILPNIFAFYAMIANAAFSMAGFVIYVLSIVGMYKMFEKAGEPGIAAIIPFWNVWVIFKISWGSGWYALLALIPLLNLFVLLVTPFKLGKSFGRSGLFSLGLLIFPYIFSIILGFSDSEYLGAQ